MVQPFEVTPTITGEDAVRFRRNLLQALTLSYPPEEIERQKRELKEMKELYQQFTEITGGIF